MLRNAYIANILILVPIAFWTLLSARADVLVFQGKMPSGHAMTHLVGCLWMAILVCSFIGLRCPREMIAILVLQLIYKRLFLALVIWPIARAGGTEALPPRIATSFAAIVLIWPVLNWADLLRA